MIKPRHTNKRKPALKAGQRVKRWQLQEAKAKFSEVYDRALQQGPQYVTRRGKDPVVIMPADDYEKLTSSGKERPSLVELFLACPKVPGFKVERDRSDFGREPPTFD